MKKILLKTTYVFIFAAGVLAVISPSFSKEMTPQLVPGAASSKKPGFTETISVLGREFSIKPYKASNTPLTWNDVKGLLPAELTKPPSSGSLTDEQILKEVDMMAKEKQAQFEKNLAILTDKYMDAHPKENTETVSLAFAEKFQGNDGNAISPELQLISNQYMALDYLREMLRETMGKGSPRY